MVAGGNRIRPHWRRLFAGISDLGRTVLAERRQALDRIFVEDGLTSLLPGAEPLLRRCDPIPLPLTAVEFATLEAGLAQRARLLDAVLADLYGPQSLLADGTLPPALVFPNPAFLRPCRTVAPPRGTARGHLHVYAAELLRGPDGQWRVLADRTEDAAGAGYAVDNRRALSRTVPELFGADQQLRRLRPFFETWQDVLQRLAPGSDNPGLALLTPGPTDKLWFEHVVLAHELGCSLVEPGDLTVRDGTLFLKTLRGLQRVDVLLRRQRGQALDPLEQNAGLGHAGVPGLLDAMRAGALCVVNDPGTALVEAPGFAAFLPALARQLLGEDLLVPSVPTLWLHDEAARTRVFAAPSGWRIRSALDPVRHPIPLRDLDDAALAALNAEISRAPGAYVASAAIPPSVAPCMGPEGLMPQPIVLRMFLLFDGARWRALPGGFARALSPDDVLTGRLPLHGLTKDVWVAGEDVVELAGPAQLATPPLLIRRTTGNLPSRVADNFFWFGRYLERAETSARLLRLTATRLERPALTPREIAELDTLTACLVAFGLAETEAVRGVGPAALSTALLGAAREGGMLAAQLMHISRLTGLLRDRLTGEVHAMVAQGLRTVMDSLRHLPPPRDGQRGLERLAQAMFGVLGFAAAVAGATAENMVRGGGRLFLDLGRRVERAQGIATELAYVLDQPDVATQPARLEPGLGLALVLRDSVITYRNRYLTVLQAAPVLDLILADEGNPRGLAFQLALARDLLRELAGEASPPDHRFVSSAEALLDAVRAIPGEIAAAGPQAGDQAAAAAQLPARLRALAESMAVLSDSITREYFALLPPLRSLQIEAEALRGAA